MGLKLSVVSVCAAAVAAISAFSTAWMLANTNATPGVQPGEYVTIGFAVVSAIIAALFHDNSPVAKG
jgi:hypothetical protein